MAENIHGGSVALSVAYLTDHQVKYGVVLYRRKNTPNSTCSADSKAFMMNANSTDVQHSSEAKDEENARFNVRLMGRPVSMNQHTSDSGTDMLAAVWCINCCVSPRTDILFETVSIGVLWRGHLRCPEVPTHDRGLGPGHTVDSCKLDLSMHGAAAVSSA